MKSVLKNINLDINFPPESFFKVDGLITNVVGEKEYSTRFEYTKHFKKG